ncbi:hypothetical protein FO519_001476 [Halicephalobus sp. NKZ332]|nr:hypothetical protein FO519_001476 [Halicephalobus sp. NKZ332]
MGRKRKNDDELTKPRTVVAPPAPVSDRPKRATKDSFYNNLSSITKTRKDPEEEAALRALSKPKKELKRGLGLSDKPPQLIKQEEIFVEEENSDSSPGSQSEVVLPSPGRNIFTLNHKIVRSQPNVAPSQSLVNHSQNHVKLLLARRPNGPSEISSPNKSLHSDVVYLRGPRKSLKEASISLIERDPRVPYVCDICGIACPFRADFDRHLGTHVEDFRSCAICNHGKNASLSLEDWSSHLLTHYSRIDNNMLSCSFCGEIQQDEGFPALVQHMLFNCIDCPSCFVCRESLNGGNMKNHLKKSHKKLMNRIICATCFMGFPSVNPFLTHSCSMQYRCLCEVTEVFETSEAMNQHISDLDYDEYNMHAILLPESDGRKRKFFINPHAICPLTKSLKMPESIPKFGFLQNPRVVTAGSRRFPKESPFMPQIQRPIGRPKLDVPRFPQVQQMPVARTGPRLRLTNPQQFSRPQGIAQEPAKKVMPSDLLISCQDCNTTSSILYHVGHVEAVHFNKGCFSDFIPKNASLCICRDCCIAFESHYQLYEHLRAHQKKQMPAKDVNCVDCSMICSNTVELAVHQENGHSYICTRCPDGYMFGKEMDFYGHLRAVHGIDLFYFCKSCNIGSSNAKSVLDHLEIGKCPGSFGICSLSAFKYRPISVNNFEKLVTDQVIKYSMKAADFSSIELRSEETHTIPDDFIEFDDDVKLKNTWFIAVKRNKKAMAAEIEDVFWIPYLLTIAGFYETVFK